MIPSIRSFNELMIITQPVDQQTSSSSNKEHDYLCKNRGQRKQHLDNNHERETHLPVITRKRRSKWIKDSEAVSKFFAKLDYNNQIQSSYDLTLIERQKNHDYHDIA